MNSPKPVLGACLLTLFAMLATYCWSTGLAQDAAATKEKIPQSAVLKFELRSQKETSAGSGRYHRIAESQQWQASQTAVIVCDVWDSHHCVNAVRRVTEVAPRINRFVNMLRDRGVTVIHAPSGCMDSYAKHPSRQRAQDTPKSASIPADIGQWCDRIPSEERAAYPLDQSKGGEDDDLAEHQLWAARLAADGRNPGSPWKRQIGVIQIDREHDYISDRGDEIWSIMDARGIKNVILTGVHTNMCVLGRPFGLRQMAVHGKNVVLARDLTDTMYDPTQWPYVNHFSGTDRIIDHIERYVCPTITSNEVTGGGAFRFSGDLRPRLSILMAEDEYKTEQTLTLFAAQQLGKFFSVNLIYGSDSDRNTVPGMSEIDRADVLLVSVRRRPLPAAELNRIRRFVKAGKPVIGIRTASHAFSLRNQQPAPELAVWPEFDAQVFGGNYTNHYGNELHPVVRLQSDTTSSAHPILHGMTTISFQSSGSLYKVSPLAAGTSVLVSGAIPNEPVQPVAWTFVRADGGRSFYTSLGHADDFSQPAFQLLLTNALLWSCNLPPVTEESIKLQANQYLAGKGKQR